MRTRRAIRVSYTLARDAEQRPRAHSHAHLEARVDDLGVRSVVDEDAARTLLESRVAELGALTYGDVKVQPFSVERFGTTFGLIPRSPDEDDDDEGHWCMGMQPGNDMAFLEPWEGTTTLNARGGKERARDE